MVTPKTAQECAAGEMLLRDNSHLACLLIGLAPHYLGWLHLRMYYRSNSRRWVGGCRRTGHRRLLD